MFNSKHVGFNQQQEWYHGNIMRDIGNICNMTLWCLQQLVILKTMAAPEPMNKLCANEIIKSQTWNLELQHQTLRPMKMEISPPFISFYMAI